MTAEPRFDDALVAALEWADQHATALGGEVHLVRDVYGRIRVVPASESHDPKVIADELHRRLGAFSPGASSIFLAHHHFSADELHADRTRLSERVYLIERLVSEQGWRRAPVAGPGHPKRVVFYGIKGGVGRSMALVALAKTLAEVGKRVLIVDLDLESPGVTSMLLGSDELPEFGLVDWFVEDAVGRADDALLRAMIRPSRVGEVEVAGKLVVVASALGRHSIPASRSEIQSDRRLTLRDGAFIAKLGRAYASPDGVEFAQRLERLLTDLERVHRPDMVLIDSRAGLHDISAAVVPRLDATVLLFAGTTSQTWLGYRALFSTWRDIPETASRLRDRLKVVGGLIPETGRAAYLARLRRSAYDLFMDFIYPAPTESDALARFHEEDPNTPHAPLPIFWRRELVEWEPTGSRGVDPLTSEQFDAAFAEFLQGVQTLPSVGDRADDATYPQETSQSLQIDTEAPDLPGH